MIVLGIDPGYRNLGLALLRINSDGSGAELLYSKSMSVGKVTAPMSFTKFLWPALDRLNDKFGPIEAVASETPPFIMGQIKTTAFLWAVSSIIVAWAHVNKLPFRHSSPIALKRAVCRASGETWNRKFIPKKRDVRNLITQLIGDTGATSHENDAALAALLMFSKLIPDA